MNLLKELSLSNFQEGDFDKFKFIVNNLLEPPAPIKEKYIRCNHVLLSTRAFKKNYGSDPTS